MPQSAYVGIDVACAKQKRLPLAACVRVANRLETLPLRGWLTKPPLGGGNLLAMQEDFQEKFAENTVAYLREAEMKFSVKIRRVAIDAPSDPRGLDREQRRCELALGEAKINCFHTPSRTEFEEIRRRVEKHIGEGGAESHIPYANKLWMLVGFALFKRLRQEWECLEVFPQATVRAMDAAELHKSSAKGYEKQLSAAARDTGIAFTRLASELKLAAFGARHDRLDAYLCAWVASLEEHEREAFGFPPEDAIWVPRQSVLQRGRADLPFGSHPA